MSCQSYLFTEEYSTSVSTSITLEVDLSIEASWNVFNGLLPGCYKAGGQGYIHLNAVRPTVQPRPCWHIKSTWKGNDNLRTNQDLVTPLYRHPLSFGFGYSSLKSYGS